MHKRTGFTLIELLVVIAIIAVLMGILMPSLRATREHGKRAVCLSHLKQLGMSWLLYAEDYDGKIVGSNVNYPPMENWWVRWPANGANDSDELEWNEAIEKGQLYPYCLNKKLYRCTNAPKQYRLSYAIVDSMNGWCGWPDAKSSVYKKLKVTNINKIKRPSERFVFLDESPPSPGTWGIKYATEAWFDSPPKLHSKGTTFSFADGRSEFWKWRDPRTLKTTWNDHDKPQPGNVDLHNVQKAVWGDLGYDPSE